MRKYRVQVYYKHEDDGPWYPLGTWEGDAKDRQDAERKAMDELWDERLDSLARCDIEEITDEDEEQDVFESIGRT